MKQLHKTIIVGIVDRKLDREVERSSLEEARLLVETYGGEVVEVLTQNASHRDSSTYIGSGKVQEIRRIVEDKRVEIVVINSDVKASQLYNLASEIGVSQECEVWDRTQLILEIFKKHASTAEAKLQIKLAELHHHGPEMAGIGQEMSQQGGGIGVRGIGETQTEIMRRHWRDQIRTVEKKLEKVANTRTQQMKHRRKSGVPTVSIVGYTNAGKTTLFNAMSSKSDLVEDKLFATLDSSVSSVYLKNVGKEVYLSDTIGFIQDLPTKLVSAFSTTLQESVSADLLLHVLDVSDDNRELKVETVNKILASIGMENKKQVYVLNKIDKLSDREKKEIEQEYEDKLYICVSARNNENIDRLVEMIGEELMKQGLERASYLSFG